MAFVVQRAARRCLNRSDSRRTKAKTSDFELSSVEIARAGRPGAHATANRSTGQFERAIIPVFSGSRAGNSHQRVLYRFARTTRDHLLPWE